MANPRDLAEQAFALLQNALRESETRASDLSEQLKRKRAPKTRIEEQLDVLAHRLESVEAERTRWQQEAGHLEEVVDAERAKVEQLKRKLEIAESGPEKLTKKEINFWRAKAEDIDTETKDYRNRLAGLRRELLEREAIIERLQREPQSAAPQPALPADDSANLRAQLHEREERLRTLEQELDNVRARRDSSAEESADHTTESAQLRAELDALRRQIASLERAATDAHSLRAALKNELMQAQAQLGERDRQIHETQSAGERTQAMVNERDRRLVELSAELEHTRTEIAHNQKRERELRDSATQLGERIAALSRDLDAAHRQTEQFRQQAEQTELERDRLRSAQLGAERRAEQLSAELAELRADVTRGEQRQREQLAAGESLEAMLAERDRALAERDHELHERDQRLAEYDGQLQQQSQQAASLTSELEQARTAVQAADRELTSLRDTLLAANRDLEQLRHHKQRLESELSDVLTRADDAERAKHELAEQIAGLETELKEEKEAADNLSELANERREQITKLNDQVEESNERYEEAKWRLGKAAHFERLVHRRKGLVKQLLGALRAKAKANTALKAGLDGLRVYKATAEANQQKLLARIDGLKADLEEAEESVARQHGATLAKQELASAEARALELQERLNTQAELIQSLETDLKVAKAHKSGDEKSAEIDRLHKEIEAKNKELQTKAQIMEQLQADTDEQQRKLAKLRGSESETMRLKAISEKDRSSIDALEREIAQLRDALMRQQAQNGGNGAGFHDTAELEAKLKERENSVTRLMGTIKEHETTIKKLSESTESWKRKYQFLATDSPDAYKTVAEK